MMTQKMRVEALVTALVNPTVSICTFFAFDWARDLRIDVGLWVYVLGWLVLFVNSFYRERRKALRRVEGVE